MRLRLLTYNIFRGGRGRAPAIAKIIDACAPDVVLLQEATDPAIVEEIARLTHMADWRAFSRQSLAFLSRRPVARAAWIRPHVSRHAFIEIDLPGDTLRIFGVHLSAVHAAWTERRRTLELHALLRSVARHKHGFHVLAGDFNTLAPGEPLDMKSLPLRLRPFVWLSGGRIRWRTVQTVLDAHYVDAYRFKHPGDRGLTMPSWKPNVRLDYVFVPEAYAERVIACDIVQHAGTAEASDHLPVVTDLQLDPEPD